ncbi:MAG: hypothetical protein JSV49_09565 [Thermoplasmata archaeon]|nr:MAG: hypothetical protein JSV49_09565 [Thermoplasmata archaeon]
MKILKVNRVPNKQLLLVLSILLVLCPSPISQSVSGLPPAGDSTELNREVDEIWRYTDLWANSEQINDLVVADILPAVPGDEIITVSSDYWVSLITGNGYSWHSEQIYRDGFMLSAIAVGNFYPAHPGDEIVVVGWNATVTMLYFDSAQNRWHVENIYEDWNYLHDVAVGDIDPDIPGDEIVTVGDSFRVSYIYYDQSSSDWESEIIWTDKDYLGVVTVGEIEDESNGAEILVSGGSYDITLLSGTSGNWYAKHIYHDSTFINELEIAELDGNENTAEILSMGFSKNLIMLTKNSTGNWDPELVWFDKGNVNDLVAGDFSDSNAGLELIAIGGTGKIVMLSPQGSSWQNETLYSISHYPFKLVMGDFDLFHSGMEFAMLESIGRLSALYAEYYDFSLFSPLETMTVFSGERFQLDLMVISNSGFSELVYLSVENIIDSSSSRSKLDYVTCTRAGSEVRTNYADHIEIDFDDTALVPTNFTAVTVTILESAPEGEVELIFVGATEDISHYTNITLKIVEPPQHLSAFDFNGVNLVLEPRISYLVADYSMNLLANLQGKLNELQNGVAATVSFSLENAPLGVAILQNYRQAVLNDDLSKYLITIRADTNVPEGEYHLIIKTQAVISESGQQEILILDRARVLQLIVEVLGSPDFLLKLIPQNEVTLTQGDNYRWTVSLISLAGFSENVMITSEKSNNALKFIFSATVLNPYQTITLELNTTDNLATDKYYLILTANSNDRYRYELISFKIEAKTPTFKMDVEPKAVTIEAGKPANLKVTFEPQDGFYGNVDLGLFHDDAGFTEWREFAQTVLVNELKTVDVVIDNLTRPGLYNFTFKADFNQTYSTSSHFSITVTAPTGSNNGSEGEDDGDEESTISLNLALCSIIGVILLIIIVAVSIIIFKRSKQGRLEKSKAPGPEKRPRGRGAEKRRVERGPVKPRKPARARAGIDRPLEQAFESEVDKKDRSASKDEDYFKLGSDVFKPGGKHEYEELNDRKIASKKKD